MKEPESLVLTDTVSPPCQVPSTRHWRELLATISHNAFEYNDDGFISNDLIPGIPLEVQFGIDEDRIEADLQYTRQFSPQLRTVTGLGYHRESIKAPFYFDTGSRLDNDVFRVFGHAEYRPRQDLVTAGIGVAALLFGLAHFGGGPVYVILATLAGIGYGLAYDLTGRLHCAVLVHFAVNAIQMLAFSGP